MLVNEFEQFALRVLRFRDRAEHALHVVGVGHPDLPQRAVHPYGVAEQQVPGARDQNLRRETLQITIDR